VKKSKYIIGHWLLKLVSQVLSYQQTAKGVILQWCKRDASRSPIPCS